MPIKEIAKKVGISEVKIRRILITEGLWHSTTSDEITELVSKGLSATEISEKLQKPLKTVQAYMPYIRGGYGEAQTYNAKQSKKFRERNKEFAKKQPIRSEVREMKNTDAWKEKSGFVGAGHKILKLHMELIADINDEEENILRKYGKVQRSISRDILVPADMLLHNLHYAIQRAFGWQNSHLHNFAYPDEVFSQLTENKFAKWLDLCGIYFRFPDEENEDIYWDDDYDESVSPRTWFKRKYSAPFYYGGECEHYLYAATQAKTLKQQNPVLRIGPSFEEFMAGKKGERMIKIDDVTIEEIRTQFETSPDELLERLPIGQVVATSSDSAWEFKTKKLIHDMNDAFAENYKKIRALKNDYEIEEFYKKTNPKVVPLSDRLIYSYDYGDGWQIEITCVDEYESFDRWNKQSENEWMIVPITEEDAAKDQCPVDKNGKELEGELREQIIDVVVKQKPLCVSADGLSVLDDVGGISGYCAFLSGVHGKACGLDMYEDKEETIEWGRSMGWNGRMNKPENIL